jgi:hypothetical protein
MEVIAGKQLRRPLADLLLKSVEAVLAGGQFVSSGLQFTPGDDL